MIFSWIRHPKQAIEAKIGKWDCIKLKTFINRVKRQPMEFEKMLANSPSQKH
jgi:hypothetical protein